MADNNPNPPVSITIAIKDSQTGITESNQKFNQAFSAANMTDAEREKFIIDGLKNFPVKNIRTLVEALSESVSVNEAPAIGDPADGPPDAPGAPPPPPPGPPPGAPGAPGAPGVSGSAVEKATKINIKKLLNEAIQKQEALLKLLLNTPDKLSLDDLNGLIAQIEGIHNVIKITIPPLSLIGTPELIEELTKNEGTPAATALEKMKGEDLKKVNETLLKVTADANKGITACLPRNFYWDAYNAGIEIIIGSMKRSPFPNKKSFFQNYLFNKDFRATVHKQSLPLYGDKENVFLDNLAKLEVQKENLLKALKDAEPELVLTDAEPSLLEPKKVYFIPGSPPTCILLDESNNKKSSTLDDIFCGYKLSKGEPLTEYEIPRVGKICFTIQDIADSDTKKRITYWVLNPNDFTQVITKEIELELDHAENESEETFNKKIFSRILAEDNLESQENMKKLYSAQLHELKPVIITALKNDDLLPEAEHLTKMRKDLKTQMDEYVGDVKTYFDGLKPMQNELSFSKFESTALSLRTYGQDSNMIPFLEKSTKKIGESVTNFLTTHKEVITKIQKLSALIPVLINKKEKIDHEIKLLLEQFSFLPEVVKNQIEGFNQKIKTLEKTKKELAADKNSLENKLESLREKIAKSTGVSYKKLSPEKIKEELEKLTRVEQSQFKMLPDEIKKLEILMQTKIQEVKACNEEIKKLKNTPKALSQENQHKIDALNEIKKQNDEVIRLSNEELENNEKTLATEKDILLKNFSGNDKKKIERILAFRLENPLLKKLLDSEIQTICNNTKEFVHKLTKASDQLEAPSVVNFNTLLNSSSVGITAKKYELTKALESVLTDVPQTKKKKKKSEASFSSIILTLQQATLGVTEQTDFLGLHEENESGGLSLFVLGEFFKQDEDNLDKETVQKKLIEMQKTSPGGKRVPTIMLLAIASEYLTLPESAPKFSAMKKDANFSNLEVTAEKYKNFENMVIDVYRQIPAPKDQYNLSIAPKPLPTPIPSMHVLVRTYKKEDALGKMKDYILYSVAHPLDPAKNLDVETQISVNLPLKLNDKLSKQILAEVEKDGYISMPLPEDFSTQLKEATEGLIKQLSTDLQTSQYLEEAVKPLKIIETISPSQFNEKIQERIEQAEKLKLEREQLSIDKKKLADKVKTASSAESSPAQQFQDAASIEADAASLSTSMTAGLQHGSVGKKTMLFDRRTSINLATEGANQLSHDMQIQAAMALLAKALQPNATEHEKKVALDAAKALADKSTALEAQLAALQKEKEREEHLEKAVTEVFNFFQKTPPKDRTVLFQKIKEASASKEEYEKIVNRFFEKMGTLSNAKVILPGLKKIKSDFDSTLSWPVTIHMGKPQA